MKIQTKTARSLGLSLALIIGPVSNSVGENERREFGSHEHGVTTLNIALDDKALMMELEGPAMNFVGFEYSPRSAENKQAIADALSVLKNAAELIVPAAAADCRLIAAQAQHLSDADDHSDHDEEHDEDHHDEHDDRHDDMHDDHDEGHDDESEESRHSEFTAEYRFQCGAPGKLNQIRVELFSKFPLTSEIETSYLGPNVQTFETLTPSKPVLKLRR